MPVDFTIRVTTLDGHEIQRGTITNRFGGSQETARMAAIRLAEKIARGIKDTRVTIWAQKARNCGPMPEKELVGPIIHWTEWEGTNRGGDFSAPWLEGSDYLNTPIRKAGK